MRARFTAHATGAFEFIHRTYRETARLRYLPEDNATDVEWTRLEIHSQTSGSAPHLATVDFSAYGKRQGAEFVHHEKAEFAREGSTWIYTRPLREGPAPIKASAPKPGRNDPCPCGSGKKYKHCCGR